MSTKRKAGNAVPSNILYNRLDELSDSITKKRNMPRKEEKIMNESKVVEKFIEIKKIATDVGITLTTHDGSFCFNDIPSAKGNVAFNSIDEVELFIYGYKLGYRSNL